MSKQSNYYISRHYCRLSLQKRLLSTLQKKINVIINKFKKNNINKKYLKLIFLLLMFSIIIWGSWVVIDCIKSPNHLLLSKLVVLGKRRYVTNDDIRQSVLALGKLSTFMAQDVKVIQYQIENIPWVKQAIVRKQWPDKLKIYILEYVPVAYWNNSQLLDSNGKIFNVPVKNINNQFIPMLFGPKGSEQSVLYNYFNMNKLLLTANFHLKKVSMSSRHSWKLTLSNSIYLELGRHDIMNRLQRFIVIYPVLFQQSKSYNKRISYVDLRYDSGLAVGWTASYLTGLEK